MKMHRLLALPHQNSATKTQSSWSWTQGCPSTPTTCNKQSLTPKILVLRENNGTCPQQTPKLAYKVKDIVTVVSLELIIL